MGASLRDLSWTTGSLVRPFVVAVALAGLAWLVCGASASAATIQVTTSIDENETGPACSLREAVAAVNIGGNGIGGCVATSSAYGTNDQITFAPNTDGSPILLTNNVIVVTRDVKIVGNGAASTIVDGQKGTPSATQVLQINSGITVSISGLTIRNGQAVAGGGISNSGTLTVTNSTLHANSVFQLGGGIANSGTMTVADSTLSDNGSGLSGGAISNTGTMIVTNSTFVSNASNDNGGGIATFGTMTVTNSTLIRNSAAAVAGGIANTGPLTVTNSTLSGNSAGTGGGAVYNHGTLIVTNSTLSGNTAGAQAGGIDSHNGSVTLRAVVLDTGVSGTNCFGPIISLGSNVADDPSCAFAGTGDQQIANGAILLGPLADNGGPTLTHALLTGSPAIDAVQGPCTSNGQAGGTPIDTDQRGKPRPSGPRCDAGAYEYLRGALSFSAPTFTVGEADGSALITVTRTGGSEGSVGATFSTANGTAVAPGDYTAATAPVTFADGDAASKTISIAIVDDTLREPNETVTLTLGSPTGGVAIGGTSTAVLTIVDNEPVVSVSIANVSVAEGNAGQAPATFTVSLTSPSSQPITAAYATADGSATAGSDYVATSGTLTFAPGETSKTIPVSIQGDTLAEPDETFTVTMASPTNATLGVAQAVGIIRNDDAVVACTPRPRVVTSPTTGGGTLNVHVEATPLNSQQNNPLRSITFGAFQNATVTMNGQAVVSGQVVTLPPNTVAADFSVARVTPGQATMVPFTVADGCGEWKTFVGGGTSASF